MSEEQDNPMPEAPYYYEIQYSPMALKVLGGVEALRSLAAQIACQWPEDLFYPEEWWLNKSTREDCPEQIKITFIEVKGVVIKIVPFLDKNGIRVIHFDPSRELHGLKPGQHRMK